MSTSEPNKTKKIPYMGNIETETPNTPPQPAEEKEIVKQVISAYVIGLALVAICVCVWLWPDLEHKIYEINDAREIRGRGSYRVEFWLGILWNRPVATILGLFGLLGLYGMIFNRGKNESDNTNKINLK